MEWVKGETLFDRLRTQCTDNRQYLIAGVRDQWIELMRESKTNHYGHWPQQRMVSFEFVRKLDLIVTDQETH